MQHAVRACERADSRDRCYSILAKTLYGKWERIRLEAFRSVKFHRRYTVRSVYLGSDVRIIDESSEPPSTVNRSLLLAERPHRDPMHDSQPPPQTRHTHVPSNRAALPLPRVRPTSE